MKHFSSICSELPAAGDIVEPACSQGWHIPSTSDRSAGRSTHSHRQTPNTGAVHAQHPVHTTCTRAVQTYCLKCAHYHWSVCTHPHTHIGREDDYGNVWLNISTECQEFHYSEGENSTCKSSIYQAVTLPSAAQFCRVTQQTLHWPDQVHCMNHCHHSDW